MKIDAWHLPWGRETVSHAILDINRGCNITCRACYNSRPPRCKTLAEIENELDRLRARRPHLRYLAVVGGEVLLHPELCEIIRLLKRRGMVAQLFTNGLLLDERQMDELAATGLEIIFVHIDSGQTRPDLPPNPTRAELRALWENRTTLIARHGIDAGLTMTAYEENLGEVRDMVEYVIDSPHVNYLLVTLFRDTENIAEIRGTIDSGMRGRLIDPGRARNDTLNNWDMISLLRKELRLRPFGFLGSNKCADDPRWLSYMVATRRGRNGQVTRYSPRPSAFEDLYVKWSLKCSGKFPMYQRQSTFQLFAQLVMNSFMGGDFAGNLRYLAAALRPGGMVRTKRLLFQCPAQIEADGTVTHCENCPDAVAKNGGLVPLCISDKVTHDSTTEITESWKNG